jgi:hypothetical protein
VLFEDTKAYQTMIPTNPPIVNNALESPKDATTSCVFFERVFVVTILKLINLYINLTQCFIQFKIFYILHVLKFV